MSELHDINDEEIDRVFLPMVQATEAIQGFFRILKADLVGSAALGWRTVRR